MASKGFKDIVEIGRQNRVELYSLYARRPKPLVDAEDRFEVDERLNYEGLVIRALDKAKTAEVAHLLKKKCKWTIQAHINRSENLGTLFSHTERNLLCHKNFDCP
ncbi:MAG: hydantoinase/oxoprolinase N-terminal domain-containing protein [Nitrososphaerales archaeon]